jgi:hypothetical protein
MKKKVFFVVVLILVVIQTYTAMGTPIEVSVITDKPIYLLGEEIGLSVTAFNPNDYEISLDARAYYNIDNVAWLPFYTMEVKPPIPLPPLSSYTWYFEHHHGPPLDPEFYPLLEVGIHSVVGKAAVDTESYIQSYPPVHFTVVPEPATIVFILTGMLSFAKCKCRRAEGGEVHRQTL